MTMNRQAFASVGVTEEDYMNWCKKYKKSYYKPEVKREFFARISDGRLVRDTFTGELIKKKSVMRKK